MEHTDVAEALKLAVECLKKAFKNELSGILLFGSRARGDNRPDSDYDFLIVLKDYVTGPVEDYFMAYRALRPFRDKLVLDTTVAVISLDDLRESLTSSLLLNALYEGIVIYDAEGVLSKVKKKVLDKLRALRVRRVKADWGYTWRIPLNIGVPFKLDVDIDDPPSHEYRIRLAEEHLDEARRALKAGALVAAVHEAQLSIENSAKAIISIFKPPSWVHNPGPELRSLLEEGRIPAELKEKILRLAEIAEEAAPHHALSSYGDARRAVTPWEIYDEEAVFSLLNMAEEALKLALRLLGELLH